MLGRRLRVDGIDRTIVGVMPRGFRFYESVDLWVPLPVDAAAPGNDDYRFGVVGRLRDGIALEQAQAAVAALSPTLVEALGAPRGELDSLRQASGFVLAPLKSGLVTPGRLVIPLVLQMLTGFVMLVVGANVGALLFARGITRQREIAVLHALGARRGRLVRQILTENQLLAVAGGLGGVLVGVWGHRLLLAVFPAAPLLAGLEFRMSWRVLGFAIGLSGLAVMLFGARPAIELSRADIGTALREWGMGTTGSKRTRRWQNRLVVSQVALSLVLLVGASLTSRSMLAVEEVDPGFDADGVFELYLSFGSGYDDERRAVTTQRVIEALAGTAGVESVGWTNFPSAEVIGGIRDRMTGTIETADGPSALPARGVRFDGVNPAFFPTFGLSLLRGSGFTEELLPGTPPVVILNEEAARRLWPDANPIGRRIRFPGAQSWLTVIGVVSDRVRITSYSPEREFGMRAAPWPEIYFAASQFDSPPSILLYARPAIDPAAFVQRVPATIAEVDANLPIGAIRTVYEREYEPNHATYRLVLQVLGAFGFIAVLLSALGAYSVISCTWAQRAREVGVRVAFGASAGDVVLLVLRHGQRLALIGVAVGTVASVALYRLAAGLFFGVRHWDPLSYALVALLLLAMAALAGLAPAWRAMGRDPVEVLRQE